MHMLAFVTLKAWSLKAREKNEATYRHKAAVEFSRQEPYVHLASKTCEFSMSQEKATGAVKPSWWAPRIDIL